MTDTNLYDDTYVDWNDAFDTTSDDELTNAINGQ